MLEQNPPTVAAINLDPCIGLGGNFDPLVSLAMSTLRFRTHINGWIRNNYTFSIVILNKKVDYCRASKITNQSKYEAGQNYLLNITVHISLHMSILQ